MPLCSVVTSECQRFTEKQIDVLKLYLSDHLFPIYQLLSNCGITTENVLLLLEKYLLVLE